MAVDPDAVRVAGTGVVYVAPKGTALPTDSDSSMSAYTDLGYVTADGVAFSFGRETTDLDAWQGTKVRTLTTREPKTVSFTLMETNADTLVTALGGGAVAANGTGEYKFTPADLGTNAELALVVEFTDGTVVYRYCFARVQVEGEVKFTLTNTDAVTLPITFGVLDSDPAYVILTNDATMA